MKHVDRAVVAQLTLSGHTAAQIAGMLGCNERTVTYARHRLGIAKPVVHHPTATWEQAETLLADGCSLAEVARTVGISRRQLARRFPGQGWTKKQGSKFGHELAKLGDARVA